VTASANIPIKYFGVEEAYKEIADTYAKNKKIQIIHFSCGF